MTYEASFHALSDPTRRSILEALRKGPRAVGDLAEEFPVTRAAVSQHLRVLKDAGLVSETPDGTRRIYQVEPEGLEELRRYIESFWQDALAGLARDGMKERARSDARKRKERK